MRRGERDRTADERDRLADRREHDADEREHALDERDRRLHEREASVLRRLRFVTDDQTRQAHRESVDEQLARSELALARGREALTRGRARQDREVAAEERQAEQGHDEQAEIDRQVQQTRTDPTWERGRELPPGQDPQPG